MSSAVYNVLFMSQFSREFISIWLDINDSCDEEYIVTKYRFPDKQGVPESVQGEV